MSKSSNSHVKRPLSRRCGLDPGRRLDPGLRIDPGEVPVQSQVSGRSLGPAVGCCWGTVFPVGSRPRSRISSGERLRNESRGESALERALEQAVGHQAVKVRLRRPGCRDCTGQVVKVIDARL